MHDLVQWLVTKELNAAASCVENRPISPASSGLGLSFSLSVPPPETLRSAIPLEHRVMYARPGQRDCASDFLELVKKFLDLLGSLFALLLDLAWRATNCGAPYLSQ